MRISRRKRRSDGARSFGGMGGASFGRSASPSMRKPVRLIRDSNGNLLLDENPSKRTGGINMNQFSDYNDLIKDVQEAAKGGKQKAIKYLQQYAATYDLPQEDVRFILRQAGVSSGYRKRVIEHLNDQICNEDFHKWVAGKDPVDLNSDNWIEFKGDLIAGYLVDQVSKELVQNGQKPLATSTGKKTKKEIVLALQFAKSGTNKLLEETAVALGYGMTAGSQLIGDYLFIAQYIDNILNQCLEDYLGSSAMGYSGSLNSFSEAFADGRRRRRSKRSRKSRRKSRRKSKRSRRSKKSKSKSLDGKRRKKRRSRKSKSKSRRKSRRSRKSKSHDGRKKRRSHRSKRSHKSKKRSRRSKRHNRKSKSHDGRKRSHKSHKKSRKSHKKSHKSIMEVMVMDGKKRSRKSRRRSRKSKSCAHAMSDGKKRRSKKSRKSRSRRSKRSKKSRSRRSRRSRRKHRKMSKSLKKALMKLL